MARNDLSSAEIRHLWMASAGLCSFRDSSNKPCRKRLVVETDGVLTNVGIVAHIIGHAPGSARHEYKEEFAKEMGFSPDNLEDVKNLTLMCQHHAKLIDDKHTRHLFPPELLFKMKEEHEKWVLSWSEDKKKKSIALIHKRLGPPTTTIEYDGEPPFIMIEAVEDQTEFTDFTPTGWEQAKKQNEEIFKRFVKKIRENEANVAELFPLSPIPLLVHLGFLITDTVSFVVYQFDRERQVWVAESPIGSNVIDDLGLNCEVTKRNGKSLAITVSVSGTVRQVDVEAALPNTVFDQLDIRISNPGLKRVLFREQVQVIQRTLKDNVESLIQTGDYEKIHLFYAGPAGLAVEIGRGINPRIWGEVCLYQYSVQQTPRYQYAFSLS
jgi:hypothetical protein